MLTFALCLCAIVRRKLLFWVSVSHPWKFQTQNGRQSFVLWSAKGRRSETVKDCGVHLEIIITSTACYSCSICFVLFVMAHRGTIPPLPKGQPYPSDAKLITDENMFKTELYKGLKSMWNVNDGDGKPKKPGECYHGVIYEPFKPRDMSIVDYRGRMTGENLAKFETKHWNSVRYHCFVRFCY